MVDVFGGARSGKRIRGPRGLPGTKGPKGDTGKRGMEDLCAWMPNTVLKNLQEQEEVCYFFIEDLEKDVKRSGNDVTEWISRGATKRNLTLSKGKKPAKLKLLMEWYPNRYILEFKDCGYEGDRIRLLDYTLTSYGFICVTFRTSGDGIQTLLSNYQTENLERYFDVSVTSSDITIRLFEQKMKKPVKVVPIQYDCQKWTTFFLEYFPSNNNVVQFRYIINNDQKDSEHFSFQRPPLEEQYIIEGCSICSRWDEPFHCFKGDLSSLEIYHEGGLMNNQGIPECVKERIIKNQLIPNI